MTTTAKRLKLLVANIVFVRNTSTVPPPLTTNNSVFNAFVIDSQTIKINTMDYVRKIKANDEVVITSINDQIKTCLAVNLKTNLKR